MVCREGRAERGNRVGIARLVHGDDVRVALADNGDTTGGNRLLRVVEGKHVLRLVEDGGLLGVEVLGLRIGEHAAAERDAAPRLIVDRKHHAVVEAILQATATVNGKIAREHLGTREAPLRQMRDKLTATGRKPQVPTFADRGAKSTAPKVRAPGLRAVATATKKHHRVERLRFGEAFHQPVTTRALTCGTSLLDELDARSVGKITNGIGKLESLSAHDVVEHVTAFATTEAVPQARRGVDLERRALIVMEGAASPELGATTLEHDRLGDERHEVCLLTHPLLVLVRDHAQTSTRALPTFSATQSMFPRTVRSSSSMLENARDGLRNSRNTTSTTEPYMSPSNPKRFPSRKAPREAEKVGGAPTLTAAGQASLPRTTSAA